MDEDALRLVVTRLARPHASGGQVIERAAIMAEGSRSRAILDWIADHDGQAEELVPVATRGGLGLHGGRDADGRGAGAATPRRYVLPPGALNG